VKKIYVTVMLVVLALFILGFIGGAASASGPGHVMGLDNSSAGALSLQLIAHDGNFSIYNVSIDNCLIALYASPESLANRFSYVARARDVIDRNENRNAILKFIAENPGSIQYEMNKSLNMNIGTLRYHLMILGLNHRVVSYQDGVKRVRYFVNNGTYSEDQMKVISLLKREPTSKLLGALAGQSGMTNAKISAESGLSYSDVNRYLKELTAKGIVVKEAMSQYRYQYRIVPNLEDYIAQNLRQ
jgi:predicted transcriptional regulator